MLFPGHAREFLLGGLVAVCGSLAAAVSSTPTGGRATFAPRARAEAVVAAVPALTSHRIAQPSPSGDRASVAPEATGGAPLAAPSDATLVRRLVARVQDAPDGWTDLVEVLEHADRFAPDDAHGLAVPEVALRLLTRAAHERPGPRGALAALVWGEARIPLAPLRRRAASALAPLARGHELDRLARDLAREQDQELVAAVRAALSAHPERERVREILGDLPSASPGEER